MFSWYVRSLFDILYVDLWIHGKCTDSEGNIALMNDMNDMSDMSQFDVVVPVTNEYSATLADKYSNIYL